MYDDVLEEFRRTCADAGLTQRLGLDGSRFAAWAESAAELCSGLFPDLAFPREYVTKCHTRRGFSASILTQGERVVAGLWVCQIDIREPAERLRINPAAVDFLDRQVRELPLQPRRIFYVVQLHVETGLSHRKLATGLMAQMLSSVTESGGAPALLAGRIAVSDIATQTVARRFGAEPIGVFDSSGLLPAQHNRVEYWSGVARAEVAAP